MKLKNATVRMDRYKGGGQMGKLNSKEREKIKDLIIKVQEGFDEYAETLESDEAFNDAMNDLIDYVMEL